MEENVLGRIVRSKAGRDKERCFIIIGIVDENYVLLSDGELRKISAPKKKKLKHIKVLPYTAEDIKSKLLGDGRISDKELRNSLEGFKNIINKPFKEVQLV